MSTELSSDTASKTSNNSIPDCASVAEKGDVSVSDHSSHVSLGKETEKPTTSCHPSEISLADSFLVNGLLLDHSRDSSLWTTIESWPSEPLGRSLTLRSFVVGSLAGCLGAAIYQVSNQLAWPRPYVTDGHPGLCFETCACSSF